jgi:hypothetical protein
MGRLNNTERQIARIKERENILQGCVVNTEWKSRLGEAGTDEGLILRRSILVVYFMTL